MIVLLSSNVLMLPNLPSVSQTSGKQPFSAYQNGSLGARRSREIARWIQRWENEGGSILGEIDNDVVPHNDASQAMQIAPSTHAQ
jgi:hypothetical protein